MNIERLTIPATEEHEWQVHYRSPGSSGEWIWDRAFKVEGEALRYANSASMLWDVLVIHRPQHENERRK